MNCYKYRYKRKRKRINIFKRILCVLAAVAFLCILLLFCVVNPFVYDVTCRYLKTVAIQELNNATLEALANPIAYTDVITLIKNDENEIVFGGINVHLVNKIALDIDDYATKRIEVLCKDGLEIPLGEFSGIFLLMGKGRSIKVGMYEYGYVDAEFLSTFADAGINQTLHRIYIEIFFEAYVILPLQVRNVQIKTEVLMCENIFVGKVPTIIFDRY